MMRKSFIAAFGALLLSSVAAPASADDAEVWKYRLELDTATSVFGYESAYILSQQGVPPSPSEIPIAVAPTMPPVMPGAMAEAVAPETVPESQFVGNRAPENFIRFSGIIALQGEYATLDLRPYTLTQFLNGGTQVSLGGLEARVIVPIYGRTLAVGYYHHSAHNFSEDAYGFGINLNSLFLRQCYRLGSFDFLGKGTELDTEFDGHVFFHRAGSPYELTRRTVVLSEDIGESSWRFVSRLAVTNPQWKSEPSLTLNGEEDMRLASGKIEWPVRVRMNPEFLGVVGKHLLMGPYGAFAWNVYRTEDFGEYDWSVGLRIDLEIVDTTTY